MFSKKIVSVLMRIKENQLILENIAIVFSLHVLEKY